MNLAAFERWFVTIDYNKTSINILKNSTQNFAKDTRYSSGELPLATKEEESVEDYGGEMIFTPGDIICSSVNF